MSKQQTIRWQLRQFIECFTVVLLCLLSLNAIAQDAVDAEHQSVVGDWKLEFDGPSGQKVSSTMTITRAADGNLSGIYHSGVFGDSPMKNVVFKDGELSWEVVFSTDNGDFEIAYSGKPVGNQMEGTISTEIAGQAASTPFLATSLKPITDQQQKRLYELRIYRTHAGKLPDLHKRFREHTLNLFQKHGMENLVYWSVSEGARGEEETKDNLLVYIIAHKNEAAREASWQAFLNDPEWKNVAAESEKDGPILAEPPRSILMTATDFSGEIKPNKDSDAPARLFELRHYNDGPDRVPSTVDRFAAGEKDLFTKHGMETVSFWTANDGSAFIYLLAHKDRDTSRQSWQGFFGDFREFMNDYRKKTEAQAAPQPAQRPGGGIEVRFLVPTDYSPYK